MVHNRRRAQHEEKRISGRIVTGDIIIIPMDDAGRKQRQISDRKDENHRSESGTPVFSSLMATEGKRSKMRIGDVGGLVDRDDRLGCRIRRRH